MKTNYFLLRMAIPALAMCALATACSNDDDNNTYTPPQNSIEGQYNGDIAIRYIAPTSDEAPSDKITVEAQINDTDIHFAEFPVADIVASIAGKEAGEAIGAMLGQTEYSIAYTSELDSEGKNSILTLTAEPLVITIASEDEQAEDIVVTVNIESTEAGIYTPEDDRVKFLISIPSVTIGEDEFAGLPAALTLDFDMAQK